MNVKTRMFAWLLTVAMLLTALPVSGAVVVDYSNGYGRGILAQMENAEALLYAYDTLEAALDGTPASISIAHSVHQITWDELRTVYDLLLSDHPEVFWHGNTYSGSQRDGIATALKPTYIMTGAALDTAKAALEAEVVRLTADLEGKTDYEKSLLLHDRLAAESVYTLEGYHQTAYGALVQGTAVCAGYSRAYQLLMQRAGIPAWYVLGTSMSPWGQEVSHAWNLVLLDGEWYYTDVTWDDQTKYTFYAYLNMNSEKMDENHTPTKYVEYLPVATHTCHNYFVINDLYMEQFSVDAVADVMRNNNPARIYVTGDKAAFIENYCAFLLDICDALNAPPGTVSYGYSSVGREVILQLSVDHTCDYVRQTVAATCTTDGYTVETCSYDFCHNERNRTVIPAIGAHAYDTDCDPDCNVCGAVRDAAHVYDNDCDPDCNVCGQVREGAGHVYLYPCSTSCYACGAVRPGDVQHLHEETVITPATCGNQGLSRFACAYCGIGFTMITPITGSHVYDNDCDNECNVCQTVRWVAGHVYDNDCDADCNVCGAYRTVSDHVYDDVCDPDCNECGAVRMAPHAYDNDEDTDCNVCGAERLSHLPGDSNGDGSVNTLDLAQLMRYLNGWDVEIDLDAVDVNDDGKVNNRDYCLMQRYLNGWKVTLV